MATMTGSTRRSGEPVSAGEVIAAAGDSGGRAEPELYFEIRRDGRPVDPRPWFKAAPARPLSGRAAPRCRCPAAAAIDARIATSASRTDAPRSAASGADV